MSILSLRRITMDSMYKHLMDGEVFLLTVYRSHAFGKISTLEYDDLKTKENE